MNEEAPKKRVHSPYFGTVDTKLVQFTAIMLPPDHPDAAKGERKGRPVRSPSLSPEEPETDPRPAPPVD
jgi:hypothetical protein